MSSVKIPEGDAQDIAVALLMAAITYSDLCEALHPKILVAMPPDLFNRISHHRYQDAFNRLPERIRAAATMEVLADPDIIAARQLDAEYRAEQTAGG